MTTPKNSIFSRSRTESEHNTIVQRFWSSVEKTTSCWLWRGNKSGRGYGNLWVAGVYILAHRLSYELHSGPIPHGLLVLHDCPDGDNPLCVNPDHLWIGTQQDNVHDMFRKQRNGALTHPERLARGDRHGSHTQPESVPQGERHWTRLYPERLTRGDQSWPRLHPQRMARGARHGSRTHPERVARGSQLAQAKLTEDDVHTICQRFQAGQGRRGLKAQLAREFGVGNKLIGQIFKGQCWRHVTRHYGIASPLDAATVPSVGEEKANAS